MGAYIELISSLAQMVILTWFLSAFFGYKRNEILKSIGFIAVSLIAFAEISFINAIVVYDGLLSVIVVITYIIYAQFFLKGSLSSHIFITLFAEAIIFSASSVILFAFYYFSGNNVENLISEFNIWRILMTVLIRSIEYVIFKLIVRVNNKHILTSKEWGLLVLMPFMTWVSVTIMTNATIISTEIIPHMFIISIFMVVIDFVIYFFMIKIKQDANTKLEYELLKMQYDNIRIMETNIKALYENTYSLKHDLSKHLLAVNEMAQDNNCKEILNYIKTIMGNDIFSSQKIVFTDNDIFNAIVNTKLEICKQRGIVTSISIDNEAVNNLNSEDIAVLFGNVFDNAIEASERAMHKCIDFQMKLKKEYVSIYIENSFDEKFSDINLHTSKRSKSEHGFGIRNIKKIVEKNNGMIQYFVTDDGMFCCDILLQVSNIS